MGIIRNCVWCSVMLINCDKSQHLRVTDIIDHKKIGEIQVFLRIIEIFNFIKVQGHERLKISTFQREFYNRDSKMTFINTNMFLKTNKKNEKISFVKKIKRRK